MVGNQTRVKVVKNKVAPPFKQIEFDIMYGEGVSKTGELIDLGVKAGIVEKSAPGSPSIGAHRPGPRERQAILKEHPQIAEKIERAIRQNAGLIAGQILEGASEASGEGAEGDDAATGFAEDGTVAPIAGGPQDAAAADSRCAEVQ